MIRISYLLLILFFSTSIFAKDLIIAENSIREAKEAKDLKQIFHVTNDLNLVPTTQFFYAKPKIVIKAVYPEIQSELIDETPEENVQKFNDTVFSIVQEEVKKFKKQVADDMPAGLPKSSIKNDMNIDFSTSAVSADDNPLLSIRFAIEAYVAGMAHPYQYHRTLTYDIYNGQEIQLADLFIPNSNYLAIIAEYCKNTLSKKLKDKQMLEAGTAPTAENFKNWNINPFGILITFDQAQVAPRVYGTQTVLVPYDKLAEILAPDTGVDACVKHRKKCLRNNVLTGGFLDQAINTKHGTLNPPLGTV